MRRAARVDENQPAIVRDLRKHPGVTVIVVNGAFDFVVGYEGRSTLVELKNPETPWRSRDKTRRKTQNDLVEKFTGDYIRVETLGEILAHIGIGGGE